MRAIVGARVSVFNDSKVSNEAQLASARRWCETNNAVVVGSFEDLGTSASIPPDQRDGLGHWMKPEHAGEWSVCVMSRLDRAFRSIRHCVDMARWCEEHGKLLVFAEDNMQFDYRPGAPAGIERMTAELFLIIGSWFASVELARFQERARDAQRQLRTTDRWASGKPSYGYEICPHPSGKGKSLAINPHQQQHLHDMADKLLAGWSFTRIADWANKNTDAKWNVTGVITALTAPSSQGHKMHKGEMVLDNTGTPIMVGPPLFDPATWAQIQNAAEQRRIGRRTTTKTTNPLLGIGYCGCQGCDNCAGDMRSTMPDGTPICGSSLTQQFTRKPNKTYRSYRCARTPLNCNGITYNADAAEARLEMAFLYDHGDKQVTRREFIPATNNTLELEQVQQSIQRLQRESDMGLITTPADEETYLARMSALIKRRDTLQSETVTPARYETITTDKTYADVWNTTDRRQLLLDAGIRFVLGRDKHWWITAPPE